MEEHPIQGLMTTAMENLKDMIEVNTIIGDPVESPDGSVIIPVSKVGFGFAAGGSEFMPSGSTGSGSSGSQDKSEDSNSSDNSSEAVFPFGGGSGGGVSITPVAFLIVSPKGIKMVRLDEHTHLYEKLLDFAPKAFDKIQQLLKESNQGKESKGKHNEEARANGKDKKEKGKGKEKDDNENEEKSKESISMKEDKASKDSEKADEGNKESDSDDSPSIYDI